MWIETTAGTSALREVNNIALIAQLAERIIRNDEARGSMPRESSKQLCPAMQNSKSLEDIEVVQIHPGHQTMAVHRQALCLEVRIDLPSPPNNGSVAQMAERGCYIP